MPDEPSSNPGAEAYRSTSVGRPANGDLAADATSYLRGSGYTIEGIRRGTEEIDSQAACLIEWARQRNVIIAADYTAGLKRHSGVTAEHEVFFRISDNRVVKRTHAGCFGLTPDHKGDQTAATPLFYLYRLQLMNRFFDSDFRMEGVELRASLILFTSGDRASIVVTQPWIRAEKPETPHPTRAEIDAYMKKHSFVTTARSYFGYHRESDGVRILDARPDNFIKSCIGVIPIDLVISQQPSAA